MSNSPKQKLQQTQSQTKSSLSRLQSTIQQTISTQSQINLSLHSQHQKLVNIHNNLNEVHYNVEKGNYIANGMLSLWTRIKNKITGGFKGKQGQDMPGAVGYEEKREEQRGERKMLEEGEKEEESVQNALDYLNNRMEVLKMAGKRTGEALDQQNRMLEVINAKTDKSMNGIAEFNKKAKKLLDK